MSDKAQINWPDPIRLSHNESFACPHQLTSLPDLNWSELCLNRYLKQEEGPLLPALARYSGYQATNIVLGNGSDELILNIIQALAGPGQGILIHPPTFSVYQKVARICRVAVHQVPLLDSFQLNTEEMIQTANQRKVDLIFICNPNNPTALALAEEDILRILDCTDCYVVIDEAYWEFAGNSFLKYLPHYPKLIILRTLSKAFACAGLRLGYLIADAGVRDAIRGVQMPFNLSSLTQCLGAYVIDNADHFANYIDQMLKLKQQLNAELNSLPGVSTRPSATNYLLIEVPDDPGQVVAELKRQGILVREVHHMDERLKNMIRASVGTKAQNDQFVAVLRKVLPNYGH